MRLFILMIVLTSLIAGCAPMDSGRQIRLSGGVAKNIVENTVAPENNVYYFGFDRRLDIKEDVKMYVPLLRYLERETGYKFRLHITPQNKSIADELGTGRVNFAAIGAVSYLQASEKYKVRPLVRGVGETGDSYQAVIITRPDSDIKSLKDLKGRSFAFGTPNSTQGNLIPRIMLAEQGINLVNFKSFGHMNSHIDTANAVISGHFDAGSVQDGLGKLLASKGLVRIIAVSGLYPRSGIAAGMDVPDEVAEAVKRALIKFDPNLKDRDNLYHWDQSEMPKGFVEATESDFLQYRIRAKELGIIR